jgi:hypothetical protein
MLKQYYYTSIVLYCGWDASAHGSSGFKFTSHNFNRAGIQLRLGVITEMFYMYFIFILGWEGAAGRHTREVASCESFAAVVVIVEENNKYYTVEKYVGLILRERIYIYIYIYIAGWLDSFLPVCGALNPTPSRRV